MADDPELLPLPGLDVVGRGLYLRPHQPYELKAQLFAQRSPRPYYSRETRETYCVPEGYGVNESPPPPKGAALSRLILEESWERFSKSRSLDYSSAAGALVFNVSASAHFGSELRVEHEAYYGVRSSFVALWSVYLVDASTPTEPLDVSRLPVPFSPEHRRVYDAFFERYGSHFVKRAWVGGKAEVLFSVAKSSSLSKAQIRAGLSSGFGPIPLGEADRQLRERQQALQSETHCTVLGRGGNELELAALSTFDDSAYKGWLDSISGNPQTVELGVAGIWTLVDDEQRRQALIDAYRAVATFSPLSSVFCVDEVVHFTRGRALFTYSARERRGTQPCEIASYWPALAELGVERIDAAFADDRLVDAAGESLARKVYLFRDDQCVRVDYDKKTVDPGYPRKIAEEWPGVEFERIDAVMATGPDSVYFFSGNKYARFNALAGRVDEGYPDLVQRRWLGVTFDRVDAAIHWVDGKVYFFRDDQYIRYDTVTQRADPEYPKALVGVYVEDWQLFD